MQTDTHVDVCLLTEGTYPHHEGGVSVWCDQLVRGLSDTEFAVDAISTTGNEPDIWPTPPNNPLRRSVPLWRMLDEPRATHRVPAEVLRDIDRALDLFLGGPTHRNMEVFRSLHRLARDGHLGPALLSRPAMELMLSHLGRHTVGRVVGSQFLPPPTVGDAVACLRTLEHLLRPLAAPPTPARLTHSAANGLGVLLAMSSAWELGTPFLLTEHGMYLRERFLSSSPRVMAHHERVLVLGFLERLTTAAYELATVIAPGSDFNRRWEMQCGADPHKIRTIHNGVDHAEFWPTSGPSDPDTIVWIGRLDPLKDVKTMLRAYASIVALRPATRLRIFGGTQRGNEQYVRECLSLHSQLGLGDRAVFEGRVPSVHDAYGAGRIVVSTSISEGFPYTVLEAMASGRAVVATDVGGVAEAVGDAGVMVAPGDTKAIAAVCLQLLGNPARVASLGKAARERVADQFTLELCLQRYRSLYAELMDRLEVNA
jgi:glycosyltransferase involved in cell wall biosynthesis